MSQGTAPPAATSLEGGRRGDGASFSPPPSATTATVTKWQLGVRLASHRHTAGDCCPCTPRMPGHPGARSPNGLVAQMARADGPVDPRRSRVPDPPRPLQTRSPEPRRRGSTVPVCSQAPTAGRHGPRGARSAAAVGEGWAFGAPGNMAARPSTAASRPPVPETRLGREVAEGGCVVGTLRREVPWNDLFSKNVYLKKAKTQQNNNKKPVPPPPRPLSHHLLYLSCLPPLLFCVIYLISQENEALLDTDSPSSCLFLHDQHDLFNGV